MTWTPITTTETPNWTSISVPAPAGGAFQFGAFQPSPAFETGLGATWAAVTTVVPPEPYFSADTTYITADSTVYRADVSTEVGWVPVATT